MNECPYDSNDGNKTFSIYLVGLTEELQVTLELNSNCEYEGSLVELPNHENCNKSGVCTCNVGFYDQNCECDGSNLNCKGHHAVCKKTYTSDVCKGHGQCMYGVCVYAPSTLATQASDILERFVNVMTSPAIIMIIYVLVSGPEHGKYKRGEFKCNPGSKATLVNAPSCMAIMGLFAMKRVNVNMVSVCAPSMHFSEGQHVKTVPRVRDAVPRIRHIASALPIKVELSPPSTMLTIVPHHFAVQYHI